MAQVPAGEHSKLDNPCHPIGASGRLAAAPYPCPVLPVELRIGGRPAEILFAGSAPGLAGLMQVNARIPDPLPPGEQAVELTAAGVPSQSGTTLAIR